jgi:hypothetical protein
VGSLKALAYENSSPKEDAQVMKYLIRPQLGKAGLLKSSALDSSRCYLIIEEVLQTSSPSATMTHYLQLHPN